MKKNILIIGCVIFASLTAFAQNGKFKNMTPKERAGAYTELMQADLKLSPNQLTKVAAINLKSANEMEKLKSDSIGKMDKWNKALDIQKQRETVFKSILTKEQMDLYFEKKNEMIMQLQK
ncbi:MAG: hypothetical protein ACYC25_07120 [Paludibacter sp.]